MFSDLPVKPFPDEPEFNICTTEVITPQCFYGQLLNVETLSALHELTTLLFDYAKYEMVPFRPKVNEICVAKFEDDQTWYRAMLVNFENGEKKAKVSRKNFSLIIILVV